MSMLPGKRISLNILLIEFITFAKIRPTKIHLSSFSIDNCTGTFREKRMFFSKPSANAP